MKELWNHPHCLQTLLALSNKYYRVCVFIVNTTSSGTTGDTSRPVCESVSREAEPRWEAQLNMAVPYHRLGAQDKEKEEGRKAG